MCKNVKSYTVSLRVQIFAQALFLCTNLDILITHSLKNWLQVAASAFVTRKCIQYVLSGVCVRVLMYSGDTCSLFKVMTFVNTFSAKSTYMNELTFWVCACVGVRL